MVAIRASFLSLLVCILPLTVGCDLLQPAVDVTPPEQGWQPVSLHSVDVGKLNLTSNQVLNGLPNETVSIAIGEVKRDGSVSYGPFGTSAKGQNYVIALDYIKYDTRGTKVEFPKVDGKLETQEVEFRIGIGVRVLAQFKSLVAGVNLGNLYGLGLAAQTNQISGTLLVQSLGITGKSVSPLLPMPSEINVTTIQNSIQAVATIKAKLYDPEVTITPQIIGIQSNGIPLTVISNAIRVSKVSLFNRDEAATIVERAILEVVRNVSAIEFDDSHSKSQRKDLADKLQILERIEATYPPEEQSDIKHLARGIVELSQKNYDRAIAEIPKSRQQLPESYYFLAAAYARKNDLKRAKAAIGMVKQISEWMKHVDSLYGERLAAMASVGDGNLALEATDLDTAKVSFQDAIRHDPSLWSAHYNLAAVFSLKKDYQNCVSRLKEFATHSNIPIGEVIDLVVSDPDKYFTNLQNERPNWKTELKN